MLQLVQRDASLAQAEIARKVGLSTAAVHERLKKLEASGVIRRWTAVVDGRGGRRRRSRRSSRCSSITRATSPG